MLPIPLLATKLYIPAAGQSLVRRLQLFEQLEAGMAPGVRLTLITAPAGFGKTTLVSSWIAGQLPAEQRPAPLIAWLSLEDGDNDPVIFWSYVISALQARRKAIGKQALSQLQSAARPNLQGVLALLIQDLIPTGEPFLLVLDDYHQIRSPDIHASLTFFIEHMPPAFRLMILSRTDPPLPLALMRSRGQLFEIRMADLRFTNTEAAAYLNEGMQLSLPPEAVTLLNAKTEGWIASLQLAALSMREKPDRSSFIERFGGSHAYIVDYFASEILSSLPEQVRAFLLKTSFLDRLCGSLCDQVTGQSGGQEMLERLYAANLFLVSLDDEHIWYRYHQLFAGYLSKCLLQNQRGEVPEYHLRASQWFEQNQYPHQAVEHAIRAADYPRAARLLEDVADPVLGLGEHIWLLKWIEQLPEAQMQAHLRLSIIRATIYTANGYLQAAESALQKIEAQLQSQALEPAVRDYGLGRVAALHAMLAIQRGEVDNARRNAVLALDRLPKGTRLEAPWRADTLLALGLSNFAIGNLAEARQNLEMALIDANLAGSPFTFLNVTAYLIEVLWIQGQLKKAVEIGQQGLKFIDQNNLDSAPISGQVLLGHCLLLCERSKHSDLGQAEEFLQRGTELVRSGGVPWNLAWAYYVKMRYLIARGDLRAADRAGQEAGQLPHISEFPLWLVSGISALQALIWVRLGQLDPAEQFLKKRGIWTDSPVRYSYQREYLSLAALLIARGDLKSAGALLDSITAWAEATGQSRTLICAWTLRCMAFAAQNEMGLALHALATAMELAEPEGYVLTILELGDATAPLLYEAVRKGLHAEFASRLLKALPETLPVPLERYESPNHSPAVLTPLRPREIEVLKLVAGGHTNKEIALNLHISLRTVKFHMTSIFTKLEVANRLQAVTRAKILGLVP